MINKEKGYSAIEYSKILWENYDNFRCPDFKERHFPPEVLYNYLNSLHKRSPDTLAIVLEGRSFEDREIYRIKCGTGSINVLLWSQMHGDEPIATMSICDILNFMISINEDINIKKILNTLTLHFIPMVNPDGAFRVQRRNALNIDINRDALTLTAPESFLLKEIHKKIKPKFGFNLHDQELSTVGNSKLISGMSLLAPAFDEERTDNDTRKNAKKIATIFNKILQEYIPGRVTKYDDSYEPRAFGDNMQKWGTSTLLIESGHDINDPEKEVIRKLNFVGILSTLFSIATDEYSTINYNEYENLPLNGKRAYDVIIRNVTVEQKGKKGIKVDLAISCQVDTHSEFPPKLVNVGDLQNYIGLKEINATGKIISPEILRINETFEWEKYF